MKRVWVILAGAALLLWLSLMQSRGKDAHGVTPHPAGGDGAAATELTAAAPAAAPPAASAPPASASPHPVVPAPLPQAAQPVAPQAAVPAPAADSELIPLPERHDRPHFTAAQARAGSPGKILGHAFAREKPDPTWSPGAEAAIRKITATGELVGQQLIAVECRSTVCKLQMRYDLHDRDKFDGVFGQLHDRFGTDLGFEQVSQMDNHGQQLLRVYVMREGKTLHDYHP